MIKVQLLVAVSDFRIHITAATMQRDKTLTLLCVAAMLLPLSSARAAHNVVRRADDPNTLETLVMQHSADIDHLKALVTSLQNQLGKKTNLLLFACTYALVFFSLSVVMW
jgi:hypothetical protein